MTIPTLERRVYGRRAIEPASTARSGPREQLHPGTEIETYLPSNPFQVDPAWPYRAIDHVLARCGPAGPTLLARHCERAFDTEATTASDHYGLVVDDEPADGPH